MSALPSVLILDDEIRGLETLQRILEDDFEVFTANSIAEAADILHREWVQILLCDQRMPDMSGVEFLKRVREEWPEVIRMIISGYTDSEDIISAVNDAGIYQYITKPWHPENLILTLKNAAELFQLQRQNEMLSIELKMSPEHVEKTVSTKKLTLREHFSDEDVMEGQDDARVEISCTQLTDAALIRVRDHGNGIPEDDQGKIFDPFFTTKAVGKGTGLGLYVSYGLATGLGGDLRAANHADGGAVFSLEVPLNAGKDT